MSISILELEKAVQSLNEAVVLYNTTNLEPKKKPSETLQFKDLNLVLN